jgi:Peroxidase, family 2
MKHFTTSLAALALSIQYVTAFPGVISETMIQARTANELKARNNAIEGGCPFAKREAEGRLQRRQLAGITPPFDAAQQYVSNQGTHAFVVPSGSDQRGPCPGLNAMANHNYLPHNGIGTMEDFITGTQEAFGMGK